MKTCGQCGSENLKYVGSDNSSGVNKEMYQCYCCGRIIFFLADSESKSATNACYASPALSGVQTAGRFRKKPVVIEAMQYNAYSIKIMEEIESFVGGDIGKDVDGNTVIATLEGAMKVSHLDWVIKGVKGEFYPCKPDIFEATYEKL